jgi:hypothetical protein
VSTAVDLPSGRPAASGQLTAIEQSRAIAEVQAAVVMARQFPRDIGAATEEMEQVCALPALAGRAFYAFPRAGGQVTGPTVHLMRELARIWGNVTYGVHELARDDRKGESEMQAYAWDLQTNSRPTLGFQVPHKRDRERGNGGPQELTSMRDIYENNANQGARRLRECIEAVLPVWFVDRAKELCAQTNDQGNGKPLPTRIADMLAAFGQQFSATEADIARRLGRPRAAWTGQDVAQLQVVFAAMRRGEVARDEAFPPEPAPPVAVSALGPAPQSADTAPPAVDPAEDRRQMFALIRKVGLDGEPKRADRLAFLAAVSGRPIGSSADLTPAEVSAAISQMQEIERRPDEDQPLVVAELVEHGRTIQGGAA